MPAIPPTGPTPTPSDPSDSSAAAARLDALLGPVNGVLGLNDLLLATALSAEQRDLARGIGAAAGSLLDAINHLVDLSLAESGRLELADDAFDLHALIAGAAALVRPAAARKELWLGVRLAPGLPVAVHGDPDRLRQVLVNLLGNAVRFTEHGSVQVRAAPDGVAGELVRVRVDVVDTGNGISPEVVRRLTNAAGPGAGEGGTGPRAGGPGLGLAISRELVERMGGTIDAVAAPGEGTRLTFTVLLRAGDDATLEGHLSRDDAGVPGSPLAGRRLLLADDHPVNREVAEASLERLGAEVDTAWDGLDALDRFEPGRYDAVILDTRMPHLDGPGAARELRRIEDEAMAPRVPIVALTAAADEDEPARALDAGMDAHVGKPFHVAELVAVLVELLEGSEAASGPSLDGTRAPAGAPAAAAGAAGAADPGGPPRVLVVDDSEANRRVAEALLQRRGLQTEAAADGATALHLLAAEPFDLVLLDGRMPGLDGPAVAREVRRREAAAGLSPIPIVAVTASILPEDRARMLDAGMDDHVAKPLRPDDLGAVLDRRLTGGGTRRNRAIPEPVVPRAATVPGDAAPVLDDAVVGRLADLGDADLVARMLRLFLADAAERVAEVDDAIADRDAVRLRAALHALEGIAGSLGATALDRRVRAIDAEVRRREDRGEDPFLPALGPSGLEVLLDATRMALEARLAVPAGR